MNKTIITTFPTFRRLPAISTRPRRIGGTGASEMPHRGRTARHNAGQDCRHLPCQRGHPRF